MQQLSREGLAKSGSNDGIQDDYSDADFNQSLAFADLIHHERPYEIELLFYTELPEMPDIKVNWIPEPTTDGRAEGNHVKAIGVPGLVQKKNRA